MGSVCLIVEHMNTSMAIAVSVLTVTIWSMECVAGVLLTKYMFLRRKSVDTGANYSKSMMGRNVFVSSAIISLMTYADPSVNSMKFMMGKTASVHRASIWSMGSAECALKMNNMIQLIKSVSQCVMPMKSSTGRDVSAKKHSSWSMGNVGSATLMKNTIHKLKNVLANAQTLKPSMVPDVSVNQVCIESTESVNNVELVKYFRQDIDTVYLDALDLRNTQLRKKAVSARRDSWRSIISAHPAHQGPDSMTISANASRYAARMKSYSIISASVLEATVETSTEPAPRIDALITVISMKLPSVASASKTSSLIPEQATVRSSLTAPKTAPEIREDASVLRAFITMRMDSASSA